MVARNNNENRRRRILQFVILQRYIGSQFILHYVWQHTTAATVRQLNKELEKKVYNLSMRASANKVKVKDKTVFFRFNLLLQFFLIFFFLLFRLFSCALCMLHISLVQRETKNSRLAFNHTCLMKFFLLSSRMYLFSFFFSSFFLSSILRPRTRLSQHYWIFDSFDNILCVCVLSYFRFHTKNRTYYATDNVYHNSKY